MVLLPLPFHRPRANPKIVAIMPASVPRGIRHRVDAFRLSCFLPAFTPSGRVRVFPLRCMDAASTERVVQASQARLFHFLAF
jgi:hypothetical protein